MYFLIVKRLIKKERKKESSSPIMSMYLVPHVSVPAGQEFGLFHDTFI